MDHTENLKVAFAASCSALMDGCKENVLSWCSWTLAQR